MLYCKSLLLFKKGLYKEAMKLLQNISPVGEIFIERAIRIMKLKCLYELRETQMLIHAIEAFKVNLSREEMLSNSNIKAYRNFANYMYRLSHIVDIAEFQQHKVRKLQADLEDCLLMIEREWLSEKLRALVKDERVSL